MADIPTGGRLDPRAEALFVPPDDLSNSDAYLEWLKQCVRVMQTGAICIHVGGVAANAAMRKVKGPLLVGGLSSRYRANMSTRPVDKAAEAAVACLSYLHTARNVFEAAWMPELEAAGYRPDSGAMKFGSR